MSAEQRGRKPIDDEIARSMTAAGNLRGLGSAASELIEVVEEIEYPARLLKLPLAALPSSYRSSQHDELAYALEFERLGTPEQFAWAGIPPASKLGLYAILQDYRDSLPFTPAERRWGAQALVAHISPIEAFAAARGHIIDRGQRRSITGLDMANRWWDFRRGGGEFSHGRSAFPDLVGTLTRLSAVLEPHDITPK